MDFDDIGPLQVLVVGFDADAEFSGSVLDELDRLMTRGTVRVIDLRFLTRLDESTVIELELSGLDEDEAAAYGTVIDRLRELAGQADTPGGASAFGPAQIDRVADELAVGESVGILLFEHTWATELKAAIRGAGGRMVAQGFVTPEAAMMVGAEVAAIVEAEAAIELADAIAGAAMLDAAAVVAAADDIATGAAMLDAVRALIAAGIVVDTAAATALEALVEAELVADAALDAAARAVDEGAAEVERAMEEAAEHESAEA